MSDLWNQMTDGFMPHGYCLHWDGPLLLVFILGNLGVAIAYFTIPIALRKFTGKRTDLPYPYMFKLFAAFILSCGITHLIKVWTLYQPVYWIEAVADLLTAAISLLTAFLLIPIIPKALGLRGPAELEQLNRDLLAANAKLKVSEEQLQDKVGERTAELEIALEQTRKSEEQFRNLFDNMPQLAWTAAPDGWIRYYNKGWYDYTGTTSEQMLGWGWDKVHDPEFLPLVSAQWQQSIDSGTSFEMEFPLRRWDGQFRWFLTRVNPSVDKEGKVIHWIGINTDIDEQKRFAEVLEQRVEERTQAIKEQAELIELTHDAIMVRNTDGKIHFWNHGAEEMYGFSKEEATGRTSHELLNTIFPETLVQIESELNARGRWEGELIHTTKSQKQITVASRWVTKKTADSEKKQVLEISNDITLRKEAELRISEFVSTVSHELRTPLTSINGALRLMQGGIVGEFSDDAGGLIDIACEEAQRLIRLVSNMLDLQKIEEGALDLNVSAVTSTALVTRALDAVGSLAKEQSIELRSDLQTESELMLDQDRIIQVLINLLSNAIKFSAAGNSIEIKVEQKSQNMICFSVCDHGQGMAEEDLPKLFTRFQQLDGSSTRAKGGSGLGLAISKAIIEQHGGRIGVESQVGHGSTFWFEVPIHV